MLDEGIALIKSTTETNTIVDTLNQAEMNAAWQLFNSSCLDLFAAQTGYEIRYFLEIEICYRRQ